MLSYIYIPFDAFQRPSWLRENDDFLKNPHLIVGYHLENHFVVVDILKEIKDSELEAIDPNLKIIGQTNSRSVSGVQPGHVYLHFHPKSKLPVVDSRFYNHDRKFTIVLFSPPNVRNLEYFTVRPILLQSTSMGSKNTSYGTKIQLLHENEDSPEQISVCNDRILEKINGCSRIRLSIKAQCQGKKAPVNGDESVGLANPYQIFLLLRKGLLKSLIWYVGVVISILVRVITFLNTDIYGMNPVKYSTWCRQLDLRLRQVSYFPFQFLSYYDTDFLGADVQAQLGIPMSNERHNVNNSNYINLYNTIWLMINDILIGRTLYRVISKDLDKRIHWLNDALLDICFTRLDGFISWIGSDYPGGFKLNTDLGQFMELLFLWTSQSCNDLFKVLTLPLTSDNWFIFIVKMWFKLSCYFGLSFMVGFFIDYVKIVNFHTYLFSLAATKIYYRQIEMLKSLMQLFRGRKYNVLRSRIDKIEEDQLRIDQLLLGTFVFLVLIYLLPTTSAFYFLFYGFRIALFTCLKVGDKAILWFNLYPLFVVLLKLKNSRRLQGGVHFVHKGYYETTDWVQMENKALTFDEICGDFVHVFGQEGRFERFFLNFVEGNDLQVKDTSSMKFQYLMLPKNHTSLIKVWKEATEGSLR